MSGSPGAAGDPEPARPPPVRIDHPVAGVDPMLPAQAPDEAAAPGGDEAPDTPSQKPLAIGYAKSPIKKAIDERKGPKNNKRKWGDASFVHAARALNLRQGHQGTPIYSEMIASEGAARQPLRLLAKCKLSVHADMVQAHPALKQLPAQGLMLAVYQLYPCGPAAYLPAEVTLSRVEPVSTLQTNGITTVNRPLMCVVADAADGDKNSAGFEVLEKALASPEQLGFLVLRTIETQACQNNQTSTFKREREEVLVLYSNASKECMGDADESLVIGCKHLGAAFVDTNPSGKTVDAIL